MRTKRLFATGIISIIGVSLTAACGGGANDDTSASPTPAQTAAATPTSSVSQTATVVRPSPVASGFSLDSLPEFIPTEIENVRYGGTLKVSETATSPHWDPRNLQAGAFEKTAVQFYEKLIGFVPNDKDKFVHLGPILAEKWALSSDLKTITITLRKDVKWQNIAPVNGREFVASDAVYNINRFREKDAATVIFYEQIASVDAPDKYTVVITLKEPNAWAVDDLFGHAEYMVAPEVVAASGGTVTLTAIGTGPYILTKYLFRRGGTYVRNPDYWQKDAKGRVLPYVDTIELTEVTDPATALAALRTGQLDVPAQLTSQGVITAAKSIPNLRVTYSRTNPTGGTGIAFNTKKAPWNDVKVRRAFGMLFNRDKFIESEFGNDLPWFQSTPIPWEYVSDEPFSLAKMGPYFQFNPTEARKLLTEAGFPDGKMKIASSISTNYPGRGMNAVLLQQVYKQQGIDFSVLQIDGTTYSTQYYLRSHEDLGITHNNGAAYNLNWFAQNKFLPDANQNHSFINDPEVNQVIKSIKTTTDPAKLREYSKSLWDYNNLGMWTMWLPAASSLTTTSTRVQNHLSRLGSRAQQSYQWLSDAPRTSP